MLDIVADDSGIKEISSSVEEEKRRIDLQSKEMERLMIEVYEESLEVFETGKFEAFEDLHGPRISPSNATKAIKSFQTKQIDTAEVPEIIRISSSYEPTSTFDSHNNERDDLPHVEVANPGTAACRILRRIGIPVEGVFKAPWNELGLKERSLMEGLARLGIRQPNRLQLESIPRYAQSTFWQHETYMNDRCRIMTGNDVVLAAPTGSG